MKLPDVNVLIYAFRAGTPHHQICKMWLDQRVRGDEAFAISNQVLSAVVRIATNRRLFEAPSPRDEAFAFCRDIISQDHCRIVEPGPRHWAIFEKLCRETETSGARVTDAWFAALAIEHGCEWVTLDRDFARFPELNWTAPA